MNPLTERKEKKRKGECSHVYCQKFATTTIKIRGVKKDYCAEHAKLYSKDGKGRTISD